MLTSHGVREDYFEQKKDHRQSKSQQNLSADAEKCFRASDMPQPVRWWPLKIVNPANRSALSWRV